MTSSDLTSYATFTGTWSPASNEENLRRWSDFLAKNSVTWSPDADTRSLIDKLVRSGSARAGEAIELRLAKLANDASKGAGDARRLYRQRSGGRTWYVLSPEQKSALEQSGHRFEDPVGNSLRDLATIPITLGVYFAAQYACNAAGLSPNLAWGIALVAYVLTVRVVRGRWPLQPVR